MTLAPAQNEPVRQGSCLVVRFHAMASPCELLLAVDDAAAARAAATAAIAEVRRIEQKYSRYRADSVLSGLNAAAGRPCPVDGETAGLLDYADRLWQLSGGLFDITSGVLREAWHFDGSDRLPAPAAVAALLPRVGWHRVRRDAGQVWLPAGMALDLGGIGKEYAVDRALAAANAVVAAPMLLNLGGDLATNGDRHPHAWTVGIEDAAGGPPALWRLRAGALATSGDSRRFLLRDGVRYGHILDPRTGWPVAGAPRAVTTVAASCLEAGTLSTLAMLRGEGAEAFLAAQGGQYRIQR